MKKVLLSVLLLLIAVSSAMAQKSSGKMAIGVGVGLNGIGGDVAFSLVGNKLIAKVGYDFATTPNMDIREINMDEFNAVAAKYTDMKISSFPIAAKLNMNNAKLLFEYYPFEKSSFHIVAGAVFSIGGLMNCDLNTTKSAWQSYEAVRSEVRKYGEDILPVVQVSGRYLAINNGNLNLALKGNLVKPYLGVGFGRSIPRTRCGVNVDFGAWYHGKIGFSSKNEVQLSSQTASVSDGEIWSVIDKIQFYPQLNLRFVVKLF